MRRLSLIILLAVDTAVVALSTAGYLTYYLRPEVLWWTELIAVGLPYLGVFLALLTVPLLLGRRWIWAGVNILLLTLIIARTNPIDRLTTSSNPSPTDLTVMSFNVPRWWGYQMPDKTRRMADLIGRVKPDVIGLQEAPIAYYPEEAGPRAAPYVSVLFDSLGYVTLGPDVEHATWTPQPILGRIRVMDQEHFVIREEPADSSIAWVTRVHLRWSDRDFAVYNVHLHTFGEKKPWQEATPPILDRRRLIPYLHQYREAYRKRAFEVEEILRLIDQEKVPVILLGDLNSTPHNWVYAQLTRRLRDAYKEAGRGWAMTYHSKLPFARIDHVLVGPEWQVVSAQVLKADLSDHLPVVVKLRWKD